MAEFRKAIAQQVAVLANITEDQALQCIEEPKLSGKADLAVVVPKINKFNKLSGNPAQIAAEWQQKITTNQWITSATSDGQYLNFTINKAIIVEQVLKQVFEAKEKWGCSNVGQNKTVIVEYSSPNIAKPFHAGHLRSTIIGNFIANVHKALGYHTVSMNYLGDWGKQYGMLAIGFDKYGSEQKLIEDPIRHLFDVYVGINKDAPKLKDGKKKQKKSDKKKAKRAAKEAALAGKEVEQIVEEKEKELTPDQIKLSQETHEAARAYFKRMEDGDKEALVMWQRFRDLSINEYKKIYKRLNINFDVYSGESLHSAGMRQVMDEMGACNLLTADNGAIIMDLEKHGLEKVLIQKSDGTTLYMTRDIAAATSRYNEYHFDKMIYVVGAQQDLHFKQLFKTLHLLGKEFAGKCQHVNFGMVRGMATRTGNVVFLADILNEAKTQMLQVMQRNETKYAEIDAPEYAADIIGLSAVVVQDLSANRIKDYTFEWDRVCSFEGDTGPYLQFQHARMCSMERKTGMQITSDIDFSLLSEPHAQDLAVTVGKFPDAVVQAGTTLEPLTIVTYLFDLAHKVSQAHNVLWVSGREHKLAEARMALFWAARITLGNGLRLLGLPPLERM